MKLLQVLQMLLLIFAFFSLFWITIVLYFAIVDLL